MEGWDLGFLQPMGEKEPIDVRQDMEGGVLSVELELVGALGVTGERITIVRYRVVPLPSGA